MSDFSEALNTGANQIAQMQGVAQANNAWSAGQAQIQREWQEQQNAKAMAFNQNEAAKNRNWQEMMSRRRKLKIFPRSSMRHRRSVNRQITLRRNRKSDISAFLRPRETACKIVMILSSDKRQTTFSAISNKVTSIYASYGSIINRHNKWILQILITKPLVHDKSVRTER